MIEHDKQLLPLLEVMDQFAEVLVLETEQLRSNNLKGLGEIVADKGMYVHKYSHLAQNLLSQNFISSLSKEARQILLDETAKLLKIIEDNEEVLSHQQESHEIVIKLFQSSLDVETKSSTYTKSGSGSKNQHKNAPFTLNEKV